MKQFSTQNCGMILRGK